MHAEDLAAIAEIRVASQARWTLAAMNHSMGYHPPPPQAPRVFAVNLFNLAAELMPQNQRRRSARARVFEGFQLRATNAAGENAEQDLSLAN